jgi:hypothetical protein
MARSAVLMVALVGLTGFALSLVFRTDADRTAIFISGILAVVVQLTAFGVTRSFGRQNALAGYAMGAVMRGTVLALYGFMFVRMLDLPPTAALVSFAVFLFSSMLLESLLLAYES